MKLTRGLITHTIPPSTHFAGTSGLDRGLVGAWRFDTITGLMLRDYSGYGNHGIVTGATWVISECGPALDFSADNVTVDGKASLYPSSDRISVFCWVNPDSLDARNDLVKKASDYYFNLQNGHLETYLVGAAPSPGYYESDGTINTGEWSLIGFTYSEGTQDIHQYINGVLDTTHAGVSSWDPTIDDDLFIGYHTATLNWNGLIGDVRIYNRVISHAEVALLYQNMLRRSQRLGGVWPIPFGFVAAAGQPMMLRATAIPGMRQWHPRVGP